MGTHNERTPACRLQARHPDTVTARLDAPPGLPRQPRNAVPPPVHGWRTALPPLTATLPRAGRGARSETTTNAGGPTTPGCAAPAAAAGYGLRVAQQRRTAAATGNPRPWVPPAAAAPRRQPPRRATLALAALALPTGGRPGPGL
jgi:hypothetical protein